MKRFFLLLTFALILSPLAFITTASGQSRTNRLTRPCSGSTTPATVSIAAGGNITATPCSGGTVTINGVAISSTNSPSILRSYLATTVTYNNTAALADTALSVTVAPGGIYAIEATLFVTSAAVGLKVDFGGTATATNVLGEWWGRTVDDPGVIEGSRITDPTTDFGTATFNGFAAEYTFQGSVEVNAAGTFLLRGAQNVANASNTTILRGSTLTLTKLN